MRKFLVLCLLLLGQQNTFSQGSSFNVTYTAYPAAAQNAFDLATQIWSYKLNSTVSIKINTLYFTFPGGPLAITFSNGRKDFAGAPHDSTWYPTTLANSIAGTELNTGEYDMDIYVNGAFPWYFGTDGLTPPGQYDFVSVALHEIGHALGFTSLTKKDSTTGSVGFLEMSDFAPVVTSFPWPDLDSLPGIYDRFIENNSGINLLTYANPSAPLGTQLTSNQLYFNGPNTLAATGGTRARLYAPTSFELGTSILHLNESTYPVGNAEELMTPFITAGHSNFNVGPMTLGMLKDMGWSLYVGINEALPTDPTWQLYPNPAQDHIALSFLPPGEKNIAVTDAAGKTVITLTSTHENLEIPTAELPVGFYLLKVQHNNQSTVRKLIIQR